MLNILAISETGEGYGLAKKLSKERNFVKFYSETETGSGYNLPKKVNNFIEDGKDSDLILCLQNSDNISRGAEKLAEMGKLIIGSGGLYTNLKDGEFLNKFRLLLSHQKDIDKYEEVECWRMFNGEDYLPFYILNIPTRRIMEGEKGSEYLSTSNCVTIAETFRFSTTFEDIIGFLRKSGFVGFIGFKFSEKTIPQPFNTLNIGMLYSFFELCPFPFTELLLSFISGEVYMPKFKEGFGISIMLSLPPFPFFFSEFLELNYYLKEVPGAEKHIVLEDSLKINNIDCTGSFGLLGWVTAQGVSIREAQRRVYRTISNCLVSRDVQYRTDIGEGVEQVLRELKGGR